MAKVNYLIEGLSGTGKSSVHDELIRRGYTALSTDRTWGYFADSITGRPKGPVPHDNWKWDKTKAIDALESAESGVLNRDDFLHYFKKIFHLKIDDETMMRRLRERTNNEFGKKPEELSLC